MIEVHERHLNRIVKWTSQAKGSSTKKKGRIVGIAREGDVPIILANKHWPNHKRFFDSCVPIGYGKERYFVEIKNGDKKPMLYLPFVKNLEFYP